MRTPPPSRVRVRKQVGGWAVQYWWPFEGWREVPRPLHTFDTEEQAKNYAAERYAEDWQLQTQDGDGAPPQADD